MRDARVKGNDLLIEELIDDPLYKFFEDGTILTLVTKTGKISVKNVWRKAGWTTKTKYVCMHYKGHQLQVHRIIYRKFFGKLDDKLTINHKDGNPSNNSIENLELVTQSENMFHKYAVLKHKPTFGSAKINKEIADQIRIESKLGVKGSKLRVKYGLAKGTISRIINNKIWK